jgi:hypothetical protein
VIQIRPAYIRTASSAEIENFAAFTDSLAMLTSHIERPLDQPPQPPAAMPSKGPAPRSTAPDPEVVRYSLKVGLCVVVGYTIGLVTQRPDLSTILTTILITALPTYGATLRKMILRIVGVIIGGALTLLTIIIVTPNFETLPSYSRMDVNRNNVQSTAVETFPIDQFTSATDSCDVRSGGLTMGGDFTELRIRGKVQDNEIDVVFRQTATPLRPGNGYVFLGSTDAYQGWFNAFHSATATGHVIIGGETIEIDGIGYHDHNYGNVPIVEGYRGWFWARPSFGRYTTLALEVQNGQRFGGGSVPVLWVYDKETKKELVRATTLDDLTITIGSMVQFPDPLHGGA